MDERRSFANGNGPNEGPLMGWERRLLVESQASFWRLV